MSLYRPLFKSGIAYRQYFIGTESLTKPYVESRRRSLTGCRNAVGTAMTSPYPPPSEFERVAVDRERLPSPVSRRRDNQDFRPSPRKEPLMTSRARYLLISLSRYFLHKNWRGTGVTCSGTHYSPTPVLRLRVNSISPGARRRCTLGY
jgi:hypothetical protein